VRALEVLETTGVPFSSFGAGLAEYAAPAFDVGLVGLWLPRAELARRIATRFDRMRADGLEDEIRALVACSGDSSEDSSQGSGSLSRTAAQAIGYKEIIAYLDGKIASPAEAFYLAVRRTRQFARRQRMWFRRDPRIRWVGTARNPHLLAAAVLALWKQDVATVAAERA